MLDGGADYRRLYIRWHRDVEHLNLRVGKHLVNGLVDAGDVVKAGTCLGVRWVSRRDGHWVEAGIAICQEMAVTHDEPGPNAADAEVLALCQLREVVEGEIHDEQPDMNATVREPQRKDKHNG